MNADLNICTPNHIRKHTQCSECPLNSYVKRHQYPATIHTDFAWVLFPKNRPTLIFLSSVWCTGVHIRPPLTLHMNTDHIDTICIRDQLIGFEEYLGASFLYIYIETTKKTMNIIKYEYKCLNKRPPATQASTHPVFLEHSKKSFAYKCLKNC